jgi:hypothetical protein
MQNESDVQYGVEYDTPVQGGNEPVTRQKGLDRTQQTMARDPQPPGEIVQGDPLVTATRNPGNGSQQFASDGTLHSDHRSDDNTFFADHPLSDPEALPPGLARTAAALPPASAFGDMPAAAGAPPSAPPPVGVMQADQPMDRAAIKAAAIAAGFIVSDAPGVPPVAGVVASDGPGEGGADPRDQSTGPQVFSANALPVIKKAPIVPVIISASGVVADSAKPARAKAAPKVRRVKAKKGKG